jgi:hypothetical protein
MSKVEEILYAAHHRGIKDDVLSYAEKHKHLFANMETGQKMEEAYKMVLSSKESEGTLETRKWESSMILSTTYNFENENLVIEFNDGREYSYDAITTAEYDEFTKAESQGKYLSLIHI